MGRQKQIQVRVSLTENLYEALRHRAKTLGVPVTQLIKFFILKEVEGESFFLPPELLSRPNKTMRKLYDDDAYLKSEKGL